MPFSEQNFFRTLAENSADILCCVGLDRVLQYASPSCTRLLGWRQEELIGTAPEFLVHAEDLPSLGAIRRNARFRTEAAVPVTVRVRRKDGQFVWVEMQSRLILNPQTGNPLQFVLAIRDITGHKLREQKLAALAYTDALTGLLNRRAFDTELAGTWARTLRTGSQMSLLMLDVDHFKRFNDVYGHLAGDECLRAVAAAVQGTLRGEADRAARFGGEEIAVVLPGADALSAMRTAGRIRRAVQDLRLPNSAQPEVESWLSVSVGVATAVARPGGRPGSPQSLLLSADAALYKAKRRGRNRLAGTLVIVEGESARPM